MGDDTRWKGLDHEAIHKMINAGPGPSASGPQAQFWGTLSAGLNEISTKLHEKLNSLKVAWDGQSSENAQAGMSPLKDWAGNAESGSNVMKTSFELQGNYVGDARAEVPEPVRVSTPQPSGWQMAGAAGALLTGNAGPAAAVAAQAADHEGQERAKDEAARQAVVAMTKYESSSDWNADTLGRFDTPPQVIVDTPPPAGGSGVNVVETRGLNNNNNFNNNTTTTTTTHTQSTPPPVISTPPPHTPPPVVTPPPTPPQHIPTPIQHFPPTPVPPPTPPNPPFPPPTPPPPPGGNPGLPGGTFVPGYPGGGGGSNPNPSGRGNSFNQGGRGGPGGGANAFGPNAVDSEGRQPGRGGPGVGNPMAQEGMGRGGPGGGNMSGGGRGAAGGQTGAGGRRADGEDDDEHETPDYLLETEDVFGDERMVAPSVIGEKREQ